MHDRVAFVLDNMPLSENNFRFADPKAEEEMSAVIRQFRHEVYGTQIATEQSQEEPEEQQQIEQAAG